MASVDPGPRLQAALNRFKTKIGPWLGRLAFHKMLFPPTAKANAAGWPGLKASQPLPTSAGRHQGGPESTVHGQVCYSIPSYTSDIRFPSVNLNNQIELKSALASRKMSKIPHGPQLLRAGNSAQLLPLFTPPQLFKGIRAHRPPSGISLFNLFSYAPLVERKEVYKNELSVPTILSGSQDKLRFKTENNQSFFPELSFQPPLIMMGMGPSLRHWLKGI